MMALRMLRSVFADHGELEVDLLTEAGTFRARSMRLVEELSQPTRCELTIASTDDVALDEHLERPVTVVLRFGMTELRRWTLVLGRVDFDGMRGGMLHFRLELYPHFWLLGFTKDVRKWRDLPTEPILESILDRYGVVHRWDTTRPTNSRPYTVQYRESCFDFVSRMLEFEGIYYSFEEDGTMVLADRSSASPDVADLPFVLIDSSGALAHDEVGVTAFARGARVGSGAYTVNDYNWKTPSKSLLSPKTGARDAELEVYDYPTGYRDAGAGAELAGLRLEAVEAMKRKVMGTTTVPTFAPATAFMFEHEEGISYSGRYVLVRVEHTFVSRDEKSARSAQSSYENSFVAIPDAIPFRPPVAIAGSAKLAGQEAATHWPVVEGNHTVIVRGPPGEEIHTDPHGRLKAQFHWDREGTETDADSRWMRMAQEVSTSIQLSRVGWEASIAYIDGDPDRPMGLARFINGEMRPSYSQPATKNAMTIKTETYPGKAGFNELRMDDSAGTMRFDVRAERDLSNIVNNDKTETIAVDHHREIKLNLSETVEKNQTVTIGSNSVTMIKQNEQPTVKGSRTDSVGGSETVKVKGGANMAVQGDDKETVGGVRTTIAGGISLPSLNPKDMLKSVAQGVIGNAASAVGGAVAGPIGAQVASAAVSGGNVAEALRGGAESRLAAAASALVSKGSTPLGSLGGPPPTPGGGGAGGGGAGGGGAGGVAGMASAAAGALGIPQGAPDIAGALKSAIPSPQGLLSQATGGLSDVRSVGDLMQYLKGAITRRAEKRFNRMVGGAQIMIAGGVIGHQSGLLMAETVGGVKATICAKGGIEKSVTGHQISTVGGIVLRKSKGDFNVSSNKSTVRVGGMVKVEAKEKLELRSKEIELEATNEFTLKSGDTVFTMKRDGASISGTIKLEAGGKIQVKGGPDDLTG
jgi:type VI secretion system secreted protein VgrG